MTPVEFFGTTDNMREAGFISPDGHILDLSDKANGGPAGTRSMDHREISECYPGLSDTDALISAMADGYIRLSPEIPGIDTSVVPNEAQRRALSKFIRYYRGSSFMVDISNINGKMIASTDYPPGTAVAKIFSDIEDVIYSTGDELVYV